MPTRISSPPAVATPEETAAHTTATPSSFQERPPILRHREADVQLTIDPAVDGLASAKGELFVTDHILSLWDASSSSGIAIPYPEITIHAISRAAPPAPAGSALNGTSESSEPVACLYCQIDDEGQEEESEAGPREAYFQPADASSVEKIFEAVSRCAALYPSEFDPSAASFGLDPSSMVYADADGNVVGPGLDEASGEDDAEADADVPSSAGRLESLITFADGVRPANGDAEPVEEPFEDAEER